MKLKMKKDLITTTYSFGFFILLCLLDGQQQVGNAEVTSMAAYADKASALVRLEEGAPSSNLTLELERHFPYKATNLTIERIIAEFSKKTGSAVRVHDSMLGRVDIDNVHGSIRDFLNQLSTVSEIAWWHDGAAFHFELNSQVTNDVVETRGYPIDRLTKRIRELGIAQRPFPFRQSADGALLYVAGPKNYVETTADLARRLVALRVKRGQGKNIQILPRIYIGGPHVATRR